MKSLLKKIIVNPIVYLTSQLVYYVMTRLKLINFYPNPHGGIVDVLGHNSILESADYFKPFLGKIILFKRKEDLWNFALSRIENNQNVFEFGVFSGNSINFMSSQRQDLNFFGFDSFEGLQEDWGGSEFSKSHFDLGGNLPKVNPNVKLVKGWFNESLPNFFKTFKGEISMINIDCDTYESSVEVLNLLEKYIVSGTIIVFDEYFGYPGWKFGENKAFLEFVKKKNLKYSYLAIANEQQCCLIID